MLDALMRRMLGRRREPEVPPAWRVPVLCYHSWTMEGAEYQGNDHVALEADLAWLAQHGYAVLPLPMLVEVLRGERPGSELAGRRLVGLSFDDGRDHDYRDLPGADGVLVPSMHTVLNRARIEVLGTGPMAVSFVLASAEARKGLDAACGSGRGEWEDDWWAPCAAGKVLGIGNHGWDHVHDTLETVRQRDNLKGSFFHVNTFGDAEGQIAEAQAEIDRLCGGRALPLFAYPYGHVPPYVRDEYLPEHGARVGVRAAFGTGGAAVDAASPLWDIPRFVCGWHWRTPAEFAALLDAVERGER
ncbi:hypothetical protein ACNQFN_21050 [Thauera butanivorans]|uniref:hypothetical protein n=1 Tax=Thauera butanivorans TaxID=86174 RepID=UPI003AB6142C